MRVTNFAELMSGEPRAEIRCLYTGTLVRVLTVSSDWQTIEIDPQIGDAGKLTVPITTPITYQPWTFDRGNMLFPAPDGTGNFTPGTPLKICGEGDPITYASGESATVDPA
jgi:hypothetical protein